VTSAIYVPYQFVAVAAWLAAGEISHAELAPSAWDTYLAGP
jgi:hypothetical protein